MRHSGCSRPIREVLESSAKDSAPVTANQVSMLVTNHVLAGATIGALLSRRPKVAFVAGVASHLAMDALPHWGLPGEPQTASRFLRVAYRDGTAGLAAVAAFALSSGRARAAVVAGMAGAALLDVDKPARHFFDRNPVPDPVQRFHDRIQRESPHRMPAEVLVALALLALAGNVVGRRRAIAL